jgi:peptidyl-prolyl cis-trans isomerase D
MLETLRAASKSWVAAILIGMLILSFAIWGINDIFRGNKATWLAKVGDTEIDQRTFDTELRQRLRRMPGPDGRPMTVAEAQAQGIDRVVLESMIADIAVLQEARRMGLTASDQMVRDGIAAIPGLLGPDGNIDQQRLQQGLYDMGLSEAQFVELMREDLIRAQRLQTAQVGAPDPRTLAAALAAYENERRVVEYIVLPVEKAGEIPAPDDAALEAFIAANPESYTAPELRAVHIATVAPEDLMAGIEISEEATKAEYEATIHKFETLETRELQQIVYPSKEEAEAARKLIDEGKTFEDLAAAQKLTAEDTALGTLSKGDPTVPAGAFEIAEGSVSQPLEGPFGWVLIRAVKVTPGSVKPYEEVRGEVRDSLARAQAIDRIAEMRDQIDDALAATDDLAGAAETLKGTVTLKLREIPAIDAQGQDASGKPIEGLPDGSGFIADIFATEPGDKSGLGETPNNVLYVVHVDAVTPPALRTVESVRADVTAAWIAVEQAKKLKALADETIKTANETGLAAADVAKALGLDLHTSEPLQRGAGTADILAPTVAEIFKAKAGAWVTGLGAPPAIVIARVKEVTAMPQPDPKGQEREIRAAETRAIADAMADAYRQAIVAATDIRIDEARFKAAGASGP